MQINYNRNEKAKVDLSNRFHEENSEVSRTS